MAFAIALIFGAPVDAAIDRVAVLPAEYIGPSGEAYLKEAITRLLSSACQNAGIGLTGDTPLKSSVMVIDAHVRVEASLNDHRFHETFKRGGDLLPRLEKSLTAWVSTLNVPTATSTSTQGSSQMSRATDVKQPPAAEAQTQPVQRVDKPVSPLPRAAFPAKPSKVKLSDVGAPQRASQQWVSPRMSGAFRSIDVGHIRDTNTLDWAVLLENQVSLYTRSATGELALVDEYRTPSKAEAFLRVYAYDVDGDGLDELAVTAFRYGKANSFILKRVRQGEWVRVVKDVPYVLAVREVNGKPQLFGQKKHYKEGFEGPIARLKVDGGRVVAHVVDGDFPKNIDVYGSAFTAFQGEPWVFELKESGTLYAYGRRAGGESWYRRWMSGEKYGGATESIDKPEKSVFNETLSDQSFALPDIAISSTDLLECIVPQNADYLKGMVGNTPSIKWSKLHRLQWTGTGFRSVWESEPLDGKISDFKWVDVDQNGSRDLIVTVQIRDKGYFDGLNARKDSVVVVYTF